MCVEAGGLEGWLAVLQFRSVCCRAVDCRLPGSGKTDASVMGSTAVTLYVVMFQIYSVLNKFWPSARVTVAQKMTTKCKIKTLVGFARAVPSYSSFQRWDFIWSFTKNIYLFSRFTPLLYPYFTFTSPTKTLGKSKGPLPFRTKL